MGGGGQTRTLADVIMAKIEEKNAMAAGGDAGSAAGDAMAADLPPKVLEVYTSVGKLLSTYRSGKLPKAFKIVPRLANWEEVLYATDPDGWTPAATSEATRLFASNLNHKMAQRFFNLVLLPAVQVNPLADPRNARSQLARARVPARTLFASSPRIANHAGESPPPHCGPATLLHARCGPCAARSSCSALASSADLGASQERHTSAP